jgi:hypothetical protein
MYRIEGEILDPYRVSTAFPFFRISKSSKIGEKLFESRTRLKKFSRSSPLNKITALQRDFVRAVAISATLNQ